jgi:hypothetical protein
VEALQFVGFSLSVVGAFVLALLWRDLWKRVEFPGFEHGTVRVTGKGMKRVWAGVFLLAFVMGGPAVVTQTQMGMPRRDQAPAIAESAVPAQYSVSWQVRLASYQHGVSEARRDGGVVDRTEGRAVRAPVWLPLAAVLYWIAVVRVPTRRDWEAA